MSQAVSRRLLTAEVRVSPHVGPYEIFIAQSGTGTGCLRVLLFSPLNIIPPVLDTHIHLHVTLNQKANRAKRGTLPKSNALPEVGKGGGEADD
jgi:hypothetical protein